MTNHNQSKYEISSLEEYHTAISAISDYCADQSFVFRGQSNSTWELNSSAARRIQKSLDFENTDIPNEIFCAYHERLLENAKLRGFHIKEGRILSDLELLAELQHNHAATCLIDFTKNSLIALWFACSNYRTEKCGKEEDPYNKINLCHPCKQADVNGSVFVINTNDHTIFSPISYSDFSKKSLDFFLKQKEGQIAIDNPNEIINIIEINGKDVAIYETASWITEKSIWWIWEASHINYRIPIQQSIFLFNKSRVNPELYTKIIIKGIAKEKMLKELRIKYNICYETLFPDFQGFAKCHKSQEPFSLWIEPDFYQIALYKKKQGCRIEEIYESSSRAVKSNKCTKDSLRLHIEVCRKKLEWREEIFKTCIKMTTRFPLDPIGHCYLGEYYCNMNLYQKAEECLSKAKEFLQNNYDEGYGLYEFLLHLIINKSNTDEFNKKFPLSQF